MAKDDHTAFVKRVVDIVAAGEKLPPDSLASPHHCRFGRWYDNVSDDATMALPSFKAIKQPHEAVHELGRRALIALSADDAAGAQRCVADMREPIGSGAALPRRVRPRISHDIRQKGRLK